MFAPARQTLLLLRQRLPRVAKLASAPRLRRQISTFRARAIYTAFRATLHYFNPHRVSRLFDKKGMPNHPDSLHNQAVALAEDGLVYPAHTAYCRDSELAITNGAMFRPHTWWMRTFTDMHYVYHYLDAWEEGEQVEMPHIFTIAKGTPVPSNLMLIRESDDWFPLQPSRGMSLNGLNRTLNDFYDKHAVKQTAEEWYASHPYWEASDDEHVWMAR